MRLPSPPSELEPGFCGHDLLQPAAQPDRGKVFLSLRSVAVAEVIGNPLDSGVPESVPQRSIAQHSNYCSRQLLWISGSDKQSRALVDDDLRSSIDCSCNSGTSRGESLNHRQRKSFEQRRERDDIRERIPFRHVALKSQPKEISSNSEFLGLRHQFCFQLTVSQRDETHGREGLDDRRSSIQQNV